MGREANARKLRKVVKMLSIQDAGNIKGETARQYKVRPRTLRRATLQRLVGTRSITDVAHAYSRANGGLKSVNPKDAVVWALNVRVKHPGWVPGQPLPREGGEQEEAAG